MDLDVLRGRLAANLMKRGSRLGAVMDRHRLAASAALWIASDPSRYSVTPKGQVRIAQDAAKTFEYVLRSLRWMMEPQRHHGQQAHGAASKALRGFRSGSVDFAALLGHCRAFQSSRMAHLRAGRADRSRAPAERFDLTEGPGGWVKRITTERELRRVGLALENCLADGAHASDYARALREGTTAFYGLYQSDGALAGVIEVDAADGELVQAKGRRNAELRSWRRRIIEFAESAVLKVDFHQALWPIGVTDELVEHRKDTKTFRTAGGWIDVAPGVLIQRNRGGVAILRAAGWDGGVPGFWHEDHEAPAPSRFARESLTRAAIREACRAKPDLTRACLEAFAGADPALLEDWFGVAP